LELMRKVESSISVCIPVHDPDSVNEVNLRELLDSIVSQETPPLEVIITSNHKVLYLENLLSQLKPRFQVIHEVMPTSGAVDNFNNSFGLSRGEVVKFICQDDFLLHSKALGLIYQELINSPQNWLVHGTIHFISRDGTFDRKIKPKLRGDLRRGVNRIGGPTSTAFLRNSYQQMDPLLQFAYDCDWYLRMAHAVGKPKIISKPLAGVRLHDGQSTHSEEWRLDKEISHMMDAHNFKKMKELTRCRCQDSKLRL
jgi:glycosyltransferase involved in cell wall biosynthesis